MSLSLKTRSKVVVTGASSFLGCHLAKGLGALHEVIATGTRPLEAYDGVRAERLANATQRARYAILDLRESAKVSAFLNTERPDYWIHHAGFADDYSSLNFDLRRSLDSNLYPLASLYPLFQEFGIKGVIVTGSSMEYGNGPDLFHESDACLPNTPYGLSKLNTTSFSLMLAEQFKIPTAVLRIFIPFGTLDAPGKLVSAFITAMRERKTFDLTPCTQQRDFLYVGEIVKAYGRVLEKLSPSNSGIYNLCSGEVLPLKELLSILARRLGADLSLARFGAKEMRSFEAPFNGGNPKKIQESFAFSIDTSLERGVDAFVNELLRSDAKSHAPSF